MPSSKLRRPEPCGHENCGSRRFHVGDDGFTYCDRGHQQSERGTIIAEDTGELVIKGRTSRKQDSDAESTTSRASGFSGTKAFEHYLLCLQLVLRKQLRWLIDTRRLPEELETLVRDLWALRLQKVQSRVSNYDSETETEGRSQYFSSQSEGETSASASSRRSRRKDIQTKPDSNTPTLMDILSICYMGTLLLREPVTVADFYTMASEGDLLYYSAGKEIPLGMRDRLPPTYQDMLSPNPIGSSEKLQQNVSYLLCTFSEDYGMAFPPINHALILYRSVRGLGLPIEVFAATGRLARLLDLGELYWQLEAKTGSKDVMLRWPEARLMALLIVATKILFPLDEVKRHPGADGELSALAMNWTVWAELRSSEVDSSEKSSENLTYEEAMDFNQADVLKAGENQLDDYMDWLEANIATEDIRERGEGGRDADFRRALFGMFPSSRPEREQSDKTAPQPEEGESATRDRLRQSQAGLKPVRIIQPTASSEKGANRMGSFYRRTREVGELEGPLKVLYEQAARLAGLSIEGMVRATFLIERRVQKHEENARKGDRR